MVLLRILMKSWPLALATTLITIILIACADEGKGKGDFDLDPQLHKIQSENNNVLQRNPNLICRKEECQNDSEFGCRSKTESESESESDAILPKNNFNEVDCSSKSLENLEDMDSVYLNMQDWRIRWLMMLLMFVVTMSTYSYMQLTGTRMARMVNKFPGPPIVPFLGSGYIFLGLPQSLLPTISKYVNKYGRQIRIWKLHDPYVALLDAKDVEEILSSSRHINKGQDYKQLHWMNGDGLITTSGNTWRTDRKLLNPSFKYQRYDGFLDSFNKHGRFLIKILKQMYAQGDEVDNIHPAICKCTMDTVIEGVLGAISSIQESSTDPDNDMSDALYGCLKKVMKSYRTRALKPWLCLPIMRNLFGIAKAENDSKKCFTELMVKVIEERKKNIQCKRKVSLGDSEETKPFIDILLSSRSNQNLVDHAFTIFAAGFETNATAMNFTLFLLALNPQIQDKVYAELQTVFDGDRTRDATNKDVAELKYMENVILETMRIFPPAPLLSRNLDVDVTLGNGMVVPMGADVVVFVYELHNNPNAWPNPTEFDPDRFLPENSKDRHPYDYIPFSKGPRSCIGQKYAMIQMKAVLSLILREFSISTTMKREDLNIIYGTIIEVDKDVFLTLTPRL